MTNDLGKLCTLLYALFAAAMVLAAFPKTMCAGAALLLVAIILVYATRAKAAGTPFESHYHWLVRTFWIANGVYVPVLTVLIAMLISTMDFSSVSEAAESGSMDIEAITAAFLARNEGPVLHAIYGISMLFVLWWLFRCWAGFRLLRKREPVRDVMRWW